MKLLFRRKLSLYPGKAKTDNHTKVISLFKSFLQVQIPIQNPRISYRLIDFFLPIS